MPKNRYLTWDAPTEMKLFHIILSVHRIKIDYVAVAKEFGPDVPASCIESHMKKLRQKAATKGVVAPKTTPQARAKGLTIGKARKSPSKVKREKDDSDEDDEDAEVFSRTSVEEGSTDDGMTKPAPGVTMNQHNTIGGRITKKRTSPRKNKKLNYKALFDQYSAEDENTSEDAEPSLGNEMPPDVRDDVTMEEDNTVMAEI